MREGLGLGWGVLALVLAMQAPACSGASSSPDDYSAYAVDGPQCGNNHCRPGDLCVDPTYQNFAGLCRAVHH